MNLPRMAVVSSRSQFVNANWQPKNEQGCSFLGVPPLYFCSRLVSGITIFKRLTERLFQNGQGCPWFHAVATFLPSKNSRSKIDKEVNF